MSGPLAGVRVLDLTSIIMAPFATQILAGLGADVIKVESPEGDYMRHVGPMRHPGMGHIFLHANRGKRSIVLDIKQPAAREALARMASAADVFITNVRPQAMRRLRLDHPALAARNARLIYVSCTGFGQRGPYAAKPAYDDMIQAASGLAWLQGAGGEPHYVTSSLCDKITAQAMAHAVTLALLHRERRGEGQTVEVTMFETMVSFNMVEHLYGQTYVPRRTPAGYTRTLSKHRRPFRTRDGYIGVLPYSDRQWRSLFAMAGRAEMMEDARFHDMASRHANIDALYETLAGILATRTTAEWLDDLDAGNVPAMAVLSGDDLMDDMHLKAVDFWHFAEDPELGTLRMPGIPMQFSASPGSVRRLPPRLGEHSAEVLEEAGYTREEIAALADAGVTRLASADTRSANEARSP